MAGVSTMTSSQAKRIVLVAPAASAVLAFVALVKNGRSTPEKTARLIAGAAILTLLLAIMSEVAPGIAGGIALLVLATATFYLGGDAWKAVGSITQPSKIRQ